MMFLTVTVEIKAVDQKFLPLLCLLFKIANNFSRGAGEREGQMIKNLEYHCKK